MPGPDGNVSPWAVVLLEMLALNALPPIVESIAQMAKPWRDFYSHSAAASITVIFAHVAALVVGGGLAIAADRSMLRSLRASNDSDLQRHLGELNAVHKPVIVSIVVLALSGLLLAASDVDTFAVSPVFWVKMGLIALLLVNGFVLYQTESGLRTLGESAGASNDPSWRRLRITSFLSVTLWISVVLAGIVLQQAA